MNIFNVIGNISAKKEITFALNNTAILNGSIAVRRNRKDTNTGEYPTDFFNFTLFGKQAENFDKYVKVGNKVALTGRVENSTYQNKEGFNVLTTKIMVDSFEMLTPRDKASETNTYDNVFAGQPISDDDMPF